MADTIGKDNNPANNIMDVHILVRVLELPNVPEVESLMATSLSNLVDIIPYLKELEEYKRLILK